MTYNSLGIFNIAMDFMRIRVWHLLLIIEKLVRKPVKLSCFRTALIFWLEIFAIKWRNHPLIITYLHDFRQGKLNNLGASPLAWNLGALDIHCEYLILFCIPFLLFFQYYSLFQFVICLLLLLFLFIFLCSLIRLFLLI